MKPAANSNISDAKEEAIAETANRPESPTNNQTLASTKRHENASKSIVGLGANSGAKGLCSTTCIPFDCKSQIEAKHSTYAESPRSAPRGLGSGVAVESDLIDPKQLREQ
jgi:hypothetical protein